MVWSPIARAARKVITDATKKNASAASRPSTNNAPTRAAGDRKTKASTTTNNNNNNNSTARQSLSTQVYAFLTKPSRELDQFDLLVLDSSMFS